MDRETPASVLHGNPLEPSEEGTEAEEATEAEEDTFDGKAEEFLSTDATETTQQEDAAEQPKPRDVRAAFEEVLPVRVCLRDVSVRVLLPKNGKKKEASTTPGGEPPQPEVCTLNHIDAQVAFTLL